MNTKPRYSQLRGSKRILLRESVPLPAPLTLFIEPTNICNFKCVYCPESFANFEERSGGLSQLDLAAFEKIAIQVVELGRLKTLNLYMMGEPFVNKSLPDFVRIAKENNIAERVIVTSNGSLLTEQVARRVMEAGLDYLRISIYGGDAEAHALKTQSTIPLERVRANVARFRKMRDDLGASTYLYVKMIDSRDTEENQRFIDLFSPHADEVAIEGVMNWNDPIEGNLAQIDRDELLKSQFFQNKKEVCPFPFYSLVIHADLRVSICCVDWAKETVVGDLRQETLSDIWNGERLRRYQIAHLERRAHQLKGCADCTFLHTTPDNLDDLSVEEFICRIRSNKK